MSTSPRFFPPAIREALPSDEGVLLAKDRSGETLLLRIDDLRTRHHESWVKIRPVDDDFGLDVAGGVAVPVHLYHVQKDVRGALAKLLRIGAKPELSIPFYVDTGPDETVVFASEPQYAEAGLLNMGPARQLSDDAARTITVAGMQVSILKPHRPMMQRQDARLTFGRTRKFKAKTIESDDSAASPLMTQELRSILDSIGATVYESDPTGTDRLLICIKRFSQPSGANRFCQLHDNTFDTLLAEHTESILRRLKNIGKLAHGNILESHESAHGSEARAIQPSGSISPSALNPWLLEKQRDTRDLNGARRRSMMQHASLLRPGDLAVALCNGDLVESGTSAHEPDRESLETYARFLPRTQLIVVEDPAYLMLEHIRANVHDFLLSQKNSNEIMGMQYLLTEHMERHSSLVQMERPEPQSALFHELCLSESVIANIERTVNILSQKYNVSKTFSF